MGIAGAILISCKKEDTTVLDVKPDINIHKSGNIVYANLSCELPNGGYGCQCVQTTSDDDCDMPTECKESSSYPTYDSVLHVMFTPSEIRLRARNRVRITEPELIQALRNDGYPLK